MLAEKRPLKQGWILKKGGQGLFAQWKPKYIVLQETNQGYALWIYDHRDQTKRPKHEILLSEMKIDSKTFKFALLSRSAVPVTVYTKTRKFYLAFHTKLDHQEWMNLFKNLMGEAVEPVEESFFRFMRPKSRMDDDARSVYSVATNDDDDTVSVILGTSRGTSVAERDEKRSTVSSNVDTLSFCSEPVLTPYELTMLGNDTEDSEDAKLRNPYMKRKVIHEPEGTLEPWYSRYLIIMNQSVVTEEAAMQKDVQLMELIGQFQEVATFHARNIVDEYHIIAKSNLQEYTFGPDMTVSRNGILFRFACDYDTATPEEIEGALERSSAELRSINAIVKALGSRMADSPPVRFFTPLMALVDYKGFRIVCHAEMDKSVLLRPIHDLNPRKLLISEEAINALLPVSSTLNLKSHTVQIHDDRRVRVCLAATVEIHKDEQHNQYFLQCLRDIFPMDATSSKGQSFSKRFRPEFLAIYQTPLCSDGLTPMSGSSLREKQTNDEEILIAARFMRENWIPSFIKSLDNMEISPYDSHSLTHEMHQKGINMRYLGVICQHSTIPFVRNLALVEMVARISKHLFRNRLRNAILHFRSVGATSIDDQMNTYTCTLINTILGYGERTQSFLDSKIKPEMKRKFGYDVTSRQYFDLSRPALFLAIQYHCGITFQDSTEYDFYATEPISKIQLLGFHSRSKTITGILNQQMANSKDDDRLAYIVAKHFKTLGPKARLNKCNESAAVLALVAAHYNSKSRFEEARLYAQAAVSSSKNNHSLFGLSTAQLLFAIAGLQCCAVGGPDPTLLGWYRKALSVIAWHWGALNPISITLHDKMSEVYHRAKDPQRAFEFHNQSLELADQTLGNNHVVTAGYLTRAGCYLSNLGKPEQAIDKFTSALNIFTSARSDVSYIAEVHYHFADALEQRGDFDGAVEHAQKCRRLRESCFGFSDVRVIHSCRQIARMLLTPYKDYNSVLTQPIKSAYREAISCHEKVFRFLQSQQGLTRRKSSKRVSTKQILNKPASISGPMVESPFGWTPPFAKNLMHRLTKEIVRMKLDLVEDPKLRDCIRTLRQRRMEMLEADHPNLFDAEDARNTIIKMAAVTPSVYLDDVLLRISQGDECALEDLFIVIILTESETVGFKTQ